MVQLNTQQRATGQTVTQTATAKTETQNWNPLKPKWQNGKPTSLNLSHRAHSTVLFTSAQEGNRLLLETALSVWLSVWYVAFVGHSHEVCMKQYSRWCVCSLTTCITGKTTWGLWLLETTTTKDIEHSAETEQLYELSTQLSSSDTVHLDFLCTIDTAQHWWANTVAHFSNKLCTSAKDQPIQDVIVTV